jgi:hypothetical protein
MIIDIALGILLALAVLAAIPFILRFIFFILGFILDANKVTAKVARLAAPGISRAVKVLWVTTAFACGVIILLAVPLSYQDMATYSWQQWKAVAAVVALFAIIPCGILLKEFVSSKRSNK